MESYVISGIISAAISLLYFARKFNIIRPFSHIKNIFIDKDTKEEIKTLYLIMDSYGYRICESVDEKYEKDVFEVCYEKIIKNRNTIKTYDNIYSYVFNIIILTLQEMLKSNIVHTNKMKEKNANSIKITLDIMEDLKIIDNIRKKVYLDKLYDMLNKKESLDNCNIL